jgi:hypothetical protein
VPLTGSNQSAVRVQAGAKQRKVAMPLGAKYVFMVSMDVAANKEALFNEVYDREHIPNLLAVPGVLGVSRVKSQPFAVSIGGARGCRRGTLPIPRSRAGKS